MFFAFVLTLMSAIALNAQSLASHNWGTKLASEDGVDIAVVLVFDESGACELQIGADYQIKEDDVPINLEGYVTVPGTYTLNDKNLTLNLVRKEAEVDIDYEIKGMDAKTKAMMDKEIRAEIDGLKDEFKNTMLDGMPKMHNMKIVKLDNKNLVLKDDNGDDIPFYALE